MPIAVRPSRVLLEVRPSRALLRITAYLLLLMTLAGLLPLTALYDPSIMEALGKNDPELSREEVSELLVAVAVFGGLFVFVVILGRRRKPLLALTEEGFVHGPMRLAVPWADVEDVEIRKDYLLPEVHFRLRNPEEHRERLTPERRERFERLGAFRDDRIAVPLVGASVSALEVAETARRQIELWRPTGQKVTHQHA